MKHHPNRLLSRLAVALAGTALLASAAAVRADDTEIFFGLPPSGASGQPNILFIFDTSGSMSTQIVTQIPFDSMTTYPGTCDQNKIYFQSGNGSRPPSCSTTNYIDKNEMQCRSAFVALGLPNVDSRNPGLTVGHVTETAGMWNSTAVKNRTSTPQWEALSANNRSDAWVDCAADSTMSPPDGGGDPSKPYEVNGASGPYASSPGGQISWTSTTRLPNGANPPGIYTFYSGNYLNWYYNASTVTKTRLQTVQDSAKALLASLTGVNVGLMRYSSDANGGMVLAPILPLTPTNLATLDSQIDALSTSGNTPLETTLYEAALYLRGGNVDYGNTSRPVHSVDSSRTSPGGPQYQTPLLSDCQKTFIVFLTDGLPNVDYSAESKILALPGFSTTVGTSCGPDVPVDGTQSGNNLHSGRCFAPLAEYLYKTDNNPNIGGIQNVSLFTIGFGSDVSGTTTLADAARRGGGGYYTAGDTATLTTALEAIVRNILTQNTFFTSPTISVNAFNRTRNLNDLFITMFQSAGSYHWPGNLKKYRLRADGTIVDSDGNPAVDLSTGFFRTNTRSFWLDPAATDDGADVTLGGAANVLPLPSARHVYTNIVTGDLTVTANQVVQTNTAITAPMLGLAAGDIAGRAKLIEFARGADVDGAVPTAQRYDMGDPLHSQPVTVIYGGTPGSPNIDDAAVLVATNDGYLHSFDPTTGIELWSFIPQELLARMNNLYTNPSQSFKSYGLDGNLRVYKVDVNNDGVIDPSAGDKIYLVFGMGRGGSSYYGLDITNKTTPILMWTDGAAQLPFIGQTWSTAAITRVNIAGATQNALKLVAIFGGGYDATEDNVPYHSDTVGNRIFMVDLLSGAVLWHAGPSNALYSLDSTADLKLDHLTNSIPADLRVLDMTGDGFADRMYATDTGGRIWRFDIYNGNPVASLVTGGVFASVGDADLGAAATNANARRFYYAPDVAALHQNGTSFLNIAVGSGLRGHPLDSVIVDRFYALRDPNVFNQRTQASYTNGTRGNDYNPTTVITESSANLVTVPNSGTATVTIPAGSPGWMMTLSSAAGEKVLSEARTFGGEVFFTTFTPNGASASAASCTVTQGTNRLYVVNALDGTVPNNRDAKSTDLPSSGIASNAVFVFPSPDNPADPDSNASFPCTGAGTTCRPDPVCLVGLSNCGALPGLPPVRTFWTQQNVDD